ncbi:C6 transcription factor, putative [Metarhizium acridum CQMa 102]|uniref:C6 transcription factor, putative n=2 Tax=Metarhizium acridum TaxID=92637 RepID=E9E9W3_METAQ|nr:C6 transcription factor, putative [Metarhizium acridum CQMa 102]EFY87314.1 C6 transcription factor, putative [Metarhizium acridum CQMa 102]
MLVAGAAATSLVAIHSARARCACAPMWNANRFSLGYQHSALGSLSVASRGEDYDECMITHLSTLELNLTTCLHGRRPPLGDTRGSSKATTSTSTSPSNAPPNASEHDAFHDEMHQVRCEVPSQLSDNVHSRHSEADSAMGIARKISRLGSQGIESCSTFAIPDGGYRAQSPRAGVGDARIPISTILGSRFPDRRLIHELMEDYFDAVHWFSLVMYERKFRRQLASVEDGCADVHLVGISSCLPRSTKPFLALLGATIKISHALGIHRHLPHKSPDETEERKRVWWTIYTWDRFASISYGRPLSINDEDFNLEMPLEYPESPYFSRQPGASNLLYRPFLAKQVDHLSIMPSNAYALASRAGSPVPELHGSPLTESLRNLTVPDAVSNSTNNSEYWLSAAVRTGRIVELPELAQLAKESHLVAFMAINLFHAAIVLILLALSDPLSDRAQKLKRAITRVLRLQHLLGKQSALSKQSGFVLQNLCPP